jgi:hypothetical protein
MQGAAHRPGAHDAPIGDRLLDRRFARIRHAQSDGPERTEIVLRLHRDEATDHILRRIRCRIGDALPLQAQVRDVPARLHHAARDPAS